MERLYSDRKTGERVRVVGLKPATIGGRFTSMYEVVRADGTREDVVAGSFHKRYEKVEDK